jgi:3-dehydroquinate synthase
LDSVIFSSSIQNDFVSFLSRQVYTQLGIIMDSNTEKYCYPLIAEKLPAHKYFAFEAGEVHKNLNTCTNIWQWMTDCGFDRKTLIINLGGGVTGDMGGFCASTYKRGIPFVNIPTTLLSQVDASVGGKLGIDFNGFKNHIGVFTDPIAVLISDEFLKTLPQAELRSGYAEVIKHGLIQHADYFSCMKSQDWENQDWKTIIEKSVSIKKEVVEKDPKESGLRKILNFGHTIGHAFESYYLDTARHLLHGEAIAIGMITEAFLSHKKSGLTVEELNQITEFLLEVYGRIDVPPADVTEIISLCSQDKKNDADRINFSLLRKIGQCDYNIICSLEDLEEAITYYRSL